MEKFNQRLEEILEPMLLEIKKIRKSKPKHLRKANLIKLKKETDIKTKPYGIKIYSVNKKSFICQVINAYNSIDDPEFLEKLRKNINNLDLNIEYRKYRSGGPSTGGDCEFYGIYQGRKPNKILGFIKTFGSFFPNLFSLGLIPMHFMEDDYLLSIEPRKGAGSDIFDKIYGSDEDLISLKRKEKAYEALNHILKQVYKKTLTY